MFKRFVLLFLCCWTLGLTADVKAEDLTLAQGEIRFDGIVRIVDKENRTLVLNVTAFTLPNGNVSKLTEPKPKIVIINPETLLRSRDAATRAITLGDLKIGIEATVIGKDMGSGKDLPARLVVAAVAASTTPTTTPPITTRPAVTPPATTSPPTTPVTRPVTPATPSVLPATLPEGRATLRLNFAHNGSVGAYAFSPDGKLLASGANGDTAIKLWDVRSGDLLRVMEGHRSGITNLVFAPDGSFLASAAGQTLANRADASVKIWDVVTGLLQGTVKVTDVAVHSLAISPDGERIATGSLDKTIKVWSLQNGKLLGTLGGHTAPVTGLSFSPDGRSLASASHDKTVRVWDMAGLRQQQSLTGFDEVTWDVAFSPDGSMLAAAGDRKVLLWDMPAGTLRRTLQHQHYVRNVAFSPDSSTVAGAGIDNREGILLWDTGSGQKQREMKNTMRPVAFSPDGQTLVTGGPLGIQLWAAQGNEPRLQRHTPEVSALAVSPDEKLIASGGVDQVVRLWDAQTGKLVRALTGHDGPIRALSFSSGGLLASGGLDESVRLWDTQTGKLVRAFSAPKNIVDGPRQGVVSLAFSPDGNVLASGHENNGLRLWNVAAGTIQRMLAGHKGTVLSLAFSPDGTLLASAGSDKKTILWNPQDGSLRGALEGVARDVTAVTFFPDGKLLAESSTDYIRIWDMQTGKVSRTLSAYRGSAKALAIRMDAPAFYRIATAAYEGVRLLKSSNGDLLSASNDDILAVNAVAFLHSKKLLATAGRDGLVRLWDISNNEIIRPIASLFGVPPRLEDVEDLATPENSSDYIAFTPDGFYNATPGAEPLVLMQIGDKLFPAAQAKVRYENPNAVQNALSKQAATVRFGE